MNRLFSLLAVATLALLSACGDEPEPAATTPAPTRTAQTPPPAPRAAPDDPIQKMARAVGNGKPGAAVDIRYELSAKPAVGTPTELQVAFIPSAGVDSLQAKFSGMDGVTLAGTLEPSFAQVEAGKPYTHTVSLLPDRAGVFYVTVVVNTDIGGSKLARTFSVPFVVGSVPVQKKSEPVRDARGEAVEPMKADESTG